MRAEVVQVPVFERKREINAGRHRLSADFQTSLVSVLHPVSKIFPRAFGFKAVLVAFQSKGVVKHVCAAGCTNLLGLLRRESQNLNDAAAKIFKHRNHLEKIVEMHDVGDVGRAIVIPLD